RGPSGLDAAPIDGLAAGRCRSRRGVDLDDDDAIGRRRPQLAEYDLYVRVGVEDCESGDDIANLHWRGPGRPGQGRPWPRGSSSRPSRRVSVTDPVNRSQVPTASRPLRRDGPPVHLIGDSLQGHPLLAEIENGRDGRLLGLVRYKM